MSSISVSEARARLPELLTRVGDGAEITITRHGQPIAVLVRPDTLRSRRSTAALEDAERVRDLLASAAADASAEVRGLTAERAEELIRDIRGQRDAE